MRPETRDMRLETGDFNIQYLTFSLKSTLATSTRIGGISQYPYNTLNLAYHVGDSCEAVAENRRRFCSALGIDVGSLVIAQQIHGDKVAIIDDSQAGCGAYCHEEAIAGADGMITRSQSVTLAVLTADCVPILVIDPVNRAVGIAHGGWKGTLSLIAAKTILKMGDAFGTVASDCLVVLGPSIGPCCYTVGEEIVSQFMKTFGQATYIMKNRLDLRLAIQAQLVDIGVKEANILSQAPCTACNLDLYYSHRAEGGRTGRMMSVIRLKG